MTGRYYEADEMSEYLDRPFQRVGQAPDEPFTSLTAVRAVMREIAWYGIRNDFTGCDLNAAIAAADALMKALRIE